MSDTSIISKVSSYDDRNRRKTNRKYHSSLWDQHWFLIITTLLLVIIIITSSTLVYLLYKETQRNQKRRRIQTDFKRQHGLANKVLSMITKDGVIAKWFKANKGETGAIFRQLMNEMVETIFNE